MVISRRKRRSKHISNRFRVSLAFASLLVVSTICLGEGHSFEILFDRALTDRDYGEIDIRWADENRAYLAVYKTGVLEVDLYDPDREPRIVIPAGDGHGSTGIWRLARLGVSSQFMAVAAPFFEVKWKSLPAGELVAADRVFEFIVDVDVFKNRLVLLGLETAEGRVFSPDGAIAWLGSLDSNLSDLKPVLYSQAGPGARTLGNCGTFNLGVTRFLQDGKVVVVPGVDPGVYLYDAEGKLLHTWESEPLGLTARCDFDQETSEFYAANLQARSEWIHQFQTVDDVLALPEGPALVIRRSSAEGTQWRLAVLSQSNPTTLLDLPFSSPSRFTNLRADVRGSRALFLLWQDYHARHEARSRLIVTTVPK